MNRRHLVTALLGAAAAPLSRGIAFAQVGNYPTQPIKIIVMYPAGGRAESLNRVIADKISNSLNQPVLVDNRPGGAG